MEEAKTKKIVIITFLITSIVTIALLVTYFVTYTLYKDKIPTNPGETGAVSLPLDISDKEKYDELYNLIDRGEVKTDFFTIKPLSQDRVIQITVKKPLTTNKIKAETWLKENGYGDIPSEKIIYFEASN